MTDKSFSTTHREDPLHGLFRNHDAIMLLIEPKSGRILDANLAAEKFYGYELAKIKEMLITEISILPPEQTIAALVRALHEEHNYFVCSHRLANGEIRDVEVRASPIVIDGQSVLLSIVNDITAYKKAEAAQRQSAEQYRLLFNRMLDGVYRSTHEGKFVDVNPAMVKMFGYASKEEMLNIDVKKELYFAPEERGSHVLDTGQEETEVYRLRRKDGSEIWVEDHGSYVHDEYGNIIYHEGIMRDVSERKRAQSLWNKYTEQQQVMYRASRQLNAASDKQHIYEVAYEVISQLISCDTIYISSFERRTNMISLECGWHDGARVDVNKYPAIPLEPEGKGTQSEAIRAAKPLLLNNFQERLKNANTIYIFDDEGNQVENIPEDGDIPRSALVAPMIVERQVVGVIQVFNYRLNAYSESDLDLLNAFASQIAVALINLDLFQRVQQENRERKQAENSLRARTRELETLFVISSRINFVQTESEIFPQILEELARAVDADTIAIFLLEPDQTQFSMVSASGEFAPYVGYKFGVDEGASGAIFKSRQLYQTDDLANDPLRVENIKGNKKLGPAVFTPILSGEHLIGVLLAARKKGSQTLSFTTEVMRLIIAASELLGNAVNRVRLHAETLRRLDRLQTLRAVDQAIASSLDLRVTLNILLKHTLAQLQVDAADVFLFHPHQQNLQYAAAQGFRTSLIERAEIRLNDDFAGRCVMERRMIQIFDPAQTSKNPPFARLWTEEKFFNYVCAPLIAKGEIKGVMEVYSRAALNPDDEWREFLDTLAGQAAIAIDNAQMFENLQSANVELAVAYDATIEGWSRALDLRDKETEGHTQRVTELTVQLAQFMGVSDKELLHIRRGALLHDIGKMGIPDRILLKAGALTPKEWTIMRSHPILAFEMLQPINYLQRALDIPYLHHERWNGSGYPRGLKGEAIPLAARIFAVVDVYDALTSSRPYRKAWTKKKTLAYIQKRSGAEFDANVVDAFLKMI